MAIVNRAVDPSQRRDIVAFNFGPVTLTGGTYVIEHVPYSCEVKAVRLNAFGLSNVPVFEIENYAFITGSGATILNSAISTATSAGLFSTSGIISLVLGTAGSTQVQCAPNSALVLTVTGANSAAAQVCVEVVLEKLQDVVTQYGVTT